MKNKKEISLNELNIASEIMRRAIESALSYRSDYIPKYQIYYEMKDWKGQYLLDTSYQCLASISRSDEIEKTRFLILRVDNEHLPRYLAIKWLELCKQYRVFEGNNQLVNDILDNGICYDLWNNWWTKDRIYISFTMYRFLYDFPNLVRSTIEMVDAGFNFFQSIVYLHTVHCSNSGHSFLGINRSPYAYGGWDNENRNIELPIRLANYFGKKERLYSQPYSKLHDNWKVAELLKPKIKRLVDSPEMLLNDELTRTFNKVTEEVFVG